MRRVTAPATVTALLIASLGVTACQSAAAGDRHVPPVPQTTITNHPKATNHPTTTHPVGIKGVPTSPVKAAHPKAQPRSASPSALPPAVDLTGWAPAVGDQGQVSSCVAWATAWTASGWYANYQHIGGFPYAPMYLYSQINGGVDQGSNPRDAYPILQNQGIASRASYPTDYAAYDDWSTQPNAAERADAATRKTSAGEFLWDAGNYWNFGTATQQLIETALAANRPVSVSMAVFDNFQELTSSSYVLDVDDTENAITFEGGHEVTAMGYNAQGVWFQNSWGTGWGKSGMFLMTWNYLATWVHDASDLTGGFVAPGPAPDRTRPVMRALTAKVVGARAIMSTATAVDNVAVTGFQWNADHTASAISGTIFTQGVTPANPATARFTLSLGYGKWWIHARARDAAGNWSTWRTVGPWTIPLPFLTIRVTTGKLCTQHGWYAYTRTGSIDQCTTANTDRNYRWRPI